MKSSQTQKRLVYLVVLALERERETDINVKLDFENVINDFANAKASQVSVNTFSLKILPVGGGGQFCFVPIGKKYINLALLTILFLIM